MTELPPETVNAAASRVSDILKTNGISSDPLAPIHNQGTNSAVQNSPPKPKKPRSDKGTKRAPKPTAIEGKLSKEQVAHIEKLRAAMSDAETASEKAFSAHRDAQAAYYNYLEEITA